MFSKRIGLRYIVGYILVVKIYVVVKRRTWYLISRCVNSRRQTDGIHKLWARMVF